MNAKIFYNGVYGEDSTLLIRDLINITNMSRHAARFAHFVKPHAHTNLFQIFFVDNGYLELLFEEQTFIIESPSFFAIPKNVIHGLRTNDDLDAYVISISDLALEKMLALDADIFFEIDTINIVKFDLNNDLFENLYSTIKKCIYEYEHQLPAKELALEFLVGMLLIRLFRIPKESKLSLKMSDNGYKIYFRQFKNLIKESNDFGKPMDAYCAELAISHGHLHRVCIAIAGKSPKKVLIDHFISEAKTLLRNHKYTIAEVAYELGFYDPSYFTRLFKLSTEMTPRAYRKTLGI